MVTDGRTVVGTGGGGPEGRILHPVSLVDGSPSGCKRPLEDGVTRSIGSEPDVGLGRAVRTNSGRIPEWMQGVTWVADANR